LIKLSYNASSVIMVAKTAMDLESINATNAQMGTITRMETVSLTAPKALSRIRRREYASNQIHHYATLIVKPAHLLQHIAFLARNPPHYQYLTYPLASALAMTLPSATTQMQPDSTLIKASSSVKYAMNFARLAMGMKILVLHVGNSTLTTKSMSFMRLVWMSVALEPGTTKIEMFALTATRHALCVQVMNQISV
jgi:hypothetical protein